MYENRNYLIFSLTEVDKIQFSQVCQTSAETLRFSTDRTKAFIKWDFVQPYESINPNTQETITITPQSPSFITELTTAEGPYTYTEIIEILSGTEWTIPM